MVSADASGTVGGSPPLAWPYALLRGLIALVVAALLWELAARYVQDPLRVPDLLRLLQGIIWACLSDSFWGHVWSSLQSFLAGYALAAVIGVPLGLLLGFLRPARFALGPLVSTLSVAPLVMLVPLFVQWFGIGMATRVVIAFVAAVFPLAATIGAGLGREHAPPDGSQAAKTGGSDAARAVVAGLRVGVAPAVLGVVIGEMFASQVGLGNLMMLASASIDVPLMVTTFIVATLPCLVLVNILRAVETRLSR